jgi:hypothetical protein
MISRIWHGWTTSGNADAYEALLETEIFHGIAERQIAGFRGIQLLRRDIGGIGGIGGIGDLGAEVEFVTVMRFDSLDAVRAFAGEDYEVAVVPPQARALLVRFDARSQHYEVRAEREA